MFTTSCVFVSLFCCMLIYNTSFYVQDNLVRPNWCQKVQNFVHIHTSPCIFLRASPCIIHGPARPDQPVFSPQPVPLSPSLRPVTARHGPTGWPGPVGSLLCTEEEKTIGLKFKCTCVLIIVIVQCIHIKIPPNQYIYI